MGKSLTCKHCGGMLTFLVKDLDGHNYYTCGTVLTHMARDGKRVGTPQRCGAVYTESGKPFAGYIAYSTDGKVKVVQVATDNTISYHHSAT